jgi:methylisocitrate lyase
MAKKITLKELMAEECVLAPCVYDCSSARAVEMSGFKAMMFSGGELSISMNGMPDLGMISLPELEWAVGRVCAFSPLPLAVDIEDGFGGPLSVYRTCERMVKAGASAVQLEDEAPGRKGLLSREEYFAKVKAALTALKGSECMLIARTNADPATELDEGIERCIGARELGADITTIVKLSNLQDATEVARRVEGWKMYPDVSASKDGVAEVTVAAVYPLGFNLITMHYLLKASMDGMLEHGMHNFADQSVRYTCGKKGATGIYGCSGTPLFNPQKWMKFEGQFTGAVKKFTITGVEFPDEE